MQKKTLPPKSKKSKTCQPYFNILKNIKISKSFLRGIFPLAPVKLFALVHTPCAFFSFFRFLFCFSFFRFLWFFFLFFMFRFRFRFRFFFCFFRFLWFFFFGTIYSLFGRCFL